MYCGIRTVSEVPFHFPVGAQGFHVHMQISTLGSELALELLCEQEVG